MRLATFLVPGESEPRAGEVRDDGAQVEAAVRDVEDDRAAGREPREVEVEGFERHQVDGDGVGAEGVEHDETVGGGRRVGEAEARVA